MSDETPEKLLREALAFMRKGTYLDVAQQLIEKALGLIEKKASAASSEAAKV
jgi:hypothetical protein